MRGFLNDCYKVETLAAAIYDRLAGDGSYSPRLRGVFRQLARDERNHAQQIDLVLQVPVEALDAAASVAGDVIDAAVRSAQEMLEALDRGPLNAEGALRLAVRMEDQFSLVHVNQGVHFYNPRVAALFAKLADEDRAHVDRLRQCLSWPPSELVEGSPST